MPDSNYYDLSRIGLNDVFAQPVSTALMKTSGTYANWDFSHTWGIEETLNDGYPYLRYLAPDLPATAAPGDSGGTTKVTAEPSFGNHLVIQVSSQEIATPKISDAIPSSGVTNPYVSGSDIDGVDEGTNKFVVVYEADNDNRVVKFAQLTLTSGEIRPYYLIERVNNQSLATLTEGYALGTRETKTIPITRIGTGDIDNLAVTVSGTSFELTQPTVTTLNNGTPSTRFTVKAKGGLAAGTYTSTVTISADHLANVTFTVTQVVQPVVRVKNAPQGGFSVVPPSRTTIDLGDENTGATIQVRADVQTSASGATFSNVEVDDDVLVQLLGALKDKNAASQTVTTVVEGGADQVVVDLPLAAIRKAMVANTRGTLIVRTDSTTYAMPLSLLRELSKDSTEEMISISINRISGSLKEKIERAAKAQGLLLLNRPTEFKVAIGDQERSDFGENYVERIVDVDSGADPSKATAVRYDPVTESFLFVPSTFKTKDKATEVVMKSTHNSIYMVIRTEKTFSDLRGHWAKGNMELLASKLIVKGLSATEFGPGVSITRAEFTALLVRSLGLGAIASDRSFQDVNAKSWYFDDVQAAVKAGLVKGLADGTFRPDDLITREQMTVIMAAALRFVGKEPADADENKSLDRFTDEDKIHAWALDSAAISVKAGMITGREDSTFAPTAFATRAEAGSMLVRMLRYIEFID
ncbi:S-layer homology domain-containing protein [Cohnella herbarum]|uniref:S-layer homology domain-containing protein n=1 Tax=Cohnella herbarum TaxID=2728023 RepID=A0A7Z2VFG9_9BACL|nr:S-layer homology domain-containing protein [Cohnella herbarum]QJD81945.1 S-layer homology domain-containing protein [Cohnella herbarum]